MTTHNDATLPLIADAPPGYDREARYATMIGEVRNFALPGGTKMILDTDSLVLASFTPSESSLRLIKGRARFFSSAASPALVVRADTVIIRGKDAVYDVALAIDTHVTVDPITGHVLVQYETDPNASAGARPSPPSSALSTIRITAGDRLELEAGKQISTAATGIVRNNWPEGVEQFDAISLSQLIDDANRYAIKPIRLSDARLANLRISGTFHLNDTKRVAGQIAQLLDLQLNDRRDVFLLGPGCPKSAARPCP